jgi:hypothetical protein
MFLCGVKFCNLAISLKNLKEKTQIFCGFEGFVSPFFQNKNNYCHSSQ